MSVENINTTVVEGDQNTPAEEGINTGLPSDAANVATLNFELTDNVKEKYITGDGKVLGKYENLEQLVESHKNLQDKHAQYVDEVKKREKDIDGTIEAQQKEAQQIEKMKELLPQFMENNMELTPEIEEALVDTGIDVRDLKLGAIDLKERITNAHNIVGGSENYTAMMQWANESLTDAEKAAFDKDVMGAQSRFAISGLYGEYQKAVESGNTQPPQRIMGNETIQSGVKPYESRQQLLADKAYLDTAQGKTDTAAQKKYQARLAVTPTEVWRGY